MSELSQTALDSILELYRRLGARLVDLSERSETGAPSDADVAVGALGSAAGYRNASTRRGRRSKRFRNRTSARISSIYL